MSSANITIKIFGIDHKHASTALRANIRSVFKSEIKNLNDLSLIEKAEFIFIETCNRFEVLIVETSNEFSNTVRNIFISIVEKKYYELSHNKALSHLYSLAVGLESMILGEAQILGQLKLIYKSICSCDNKYIGNIGTYIHKIFQDTFRVAKLVRTQTGIGRGTNSVAYAGIEQAKKIFGNLANLNILVIGAGESAELGLKILRTYDVSAIYIANRTINKASALAEKYGAFALSLCEISRVLKLVDVIFVAIDGADKLIINNQDIINAVSQREYNIQCYIDISVPSVLPTGIRDVSGAFCFDIDSLSEIVTSCLLNRELEAEKARVIISENANNIFIWLESRSALKELGEIKARIDRNVNEENISSLYTKQSISRFFYNIFKSVRKEGIISKSNHELITRISTEILN